LEASRPSDWGNRRKHPLYNAWRELVRKKDKARAEVWQDFWVFVKDVGRRPSEEHVLSRFDEDKPFGPGNFFWREKVFTKRNDETVREYRRRYMREYAAMHPERIKKYDMKRGYGLTAIQYNLMLDAQNGVCAICKQPETVCDSRGKVRDLAVDHCHKKGGVRKLLCTRCNQGLGQFRDNPEYLAAAIEYLNSHS
jgi:hypothetical protein